MRHRGTFGGALAHADPAGDLPAVALALDAEFVIAGLNGRRTVGAAEFFVDYLTTALEEGELLVEIRVPKLQGTWGMHYEKFNRVAQAWSIVAVAAAVRREGGTHRRGADRADQHGPDPAAGERRGGGPGRRGGDPRGHRGGRGAGRRGHQPEQRPQRARPTTGNTSPRCSRAAR